MMKIINSFTVLFLVHCVLGEDKYGQKIDANFPSTRSYMRCHFCEMLVWEVQRGLQIEQSELADTVIKVCDEATRFLGVDCTSLFHELIPNVSGLLQKLTPREVCDDLQLCDVGIVRSNYTAKWNDSSDVAWKRGLGKDKVLGQDEFGQKSIRGYMRCHFCEMLVWEVQKGVQMEQSEITNTVIKVCDKATRFLGVDCTSLVHEFIPDVSVLLQKLTPRDVCDDLQLCDVGVVQSNYTSKWNDSSDVAWNRGPGKDKDLRGDLRDERLCAVCGGIIGFLHDITSREDTWTHVIKLLNSTCKIAPNENDCVDYVSQLSARRGKNFADKYLNKGVTCAFCPEENIREGNRDSLRVKQSTMKPEGSIRDTNRARLLRRRQESQTPVPAGCELCEGFGHVGQNIINNHTEELLELLRQRFAGYCSQLTGYLQSACNKEVADVMPPIVLEIVRDAIDPGFLCVYILGCPQKALSKT